MEDDCGVPEAPLVHATFRDGRAVVWGQPAFSTGHRLPRSDGAHDDGIYAGWQWHNDALSVINDRYGFCPLFYAFSCPDLLVSPSISTLLAHGVSRTLDDSAIAVFLRLDFFVGDDTPFAAIRAVPRGGLTWREGRLIFDDRPPPVPRTLTLDRRAALDEFVVRFARAVERRLARGDTITLPLSGGKDSRHILLALRRAGVIPGRCVTVRHYPPRMDQDADVAALVAARVRAPHLVLDRPASRVAAEQRKNVLTDFCSDEHVQFLPLRDYLARNPATIFDGIAGDTLVQSWTMPAAMRDAFGRDDVEASITEVLNYNAAGLESALRSLLTSGARHRFNRELAMERLRREVTRHFGGPNPANAFVFWNRTRRAVALAPFRLMGFLPRVFAPFLDFDVYDLLAGLPVDLMFDQQFQVLALHRGYPEFADLPFEAPGLRVDSPAYARQFAGELAMLARRPSQFLSRAYVVPRLLHAWTRGRIESTWFLALAVWIRQIEGLATGNHGALTGSGFSLQAGRSVW